MVNLTRKRTKPSIHSFHITGNRDKFIKDTVEVPFKPLAKKYSSLHSAKPVDRDQLCPPSTTTTNTTPWPSDCPQRNATPTTRPEENMKEE